MGDFQPPQAAAVVFATLCTPWLRISRAHRRDDVGEKVRRNGRNDADAEGARTRLGAELGVGLTGIAGPGGGSEQKPVGLVWLCVSAADGASLTRSVRLPGGRPDVRERSALVAMHMIRRLLSGERDDVESAPV